MADETVHRGAHEHKPWDLDVYRSDPDRPLDADRTVRIRYEADGEPLFPLALMLGFLTVFTLGLGRFWMINRIRQHYWDAIEIDKDPLEYTGSGLEKLLGFLIAVVILGIYLSLLSLALTFWGLVSFEGQSALVNLIGNGALVLLTPLVFFAIYRSRRYVLSRTRWRGIRFGMQPGAWGFMLRAMGYMVLTVISLGLLYPLQHFRLTAYMADRTWFGNLRFRQDGSWRALMGYWALNYVAFAAAGGIFAAIALGIDPEDSALRQGAALGAGGLLAAVIGYAAWTGYRVAAFRYMWNHRSLGEADFTCDISVGELIAIKLLGQLGVQLLSALLAALMFGLLFLLFAAISGFDVTLGRIQAGIEDGARPGDFVYIAIAALLWIGSSFAASFALTQVFLRRPVLRRQVGSMTVLGAGALALALQRAHDDVAEAGGFADALDVSFGVGF